MTELPSCRKLRRTGRGPRSSPITHDVRSVILMGKQNNAWKPDGHIKPLRPGTLHYLDTNLLLLPEGLRPSLDALSRDCVWITYPSTTFRRVAGRRALLFLRLRNAEL